MTRSLELPDNEVDQAKAYRAGIGVLPFYLQDGLQSEAMVAAVKELSRKTPIGSILEFGCNAGRNFHCQGPARRRSVPQELI